MRVMWLLNHTSARKFELLMLKRVGINEIFLPKTYPADPSFRSASIDWTEDSGLTIPAHDLAALNDIDWYGEISTDAWALANTYFDVAFIILHSPGTLASAAKHFKGVVLLRAYGMNSGLTYHKVLELLSKNGTIDPSVFKLGKRLFFGEAYSHLADSESEFLKRNRCFLPLGLADASMSDNWEGAQEKILFVCPDIGLNAYYVDIYKEFVANFGDLPYSIGGAQSVMVGDDNVLGYVSNEQHAENMKQYRVMFYHSQEPNHIHYHPFEAIRAGMPLVFMGGGMLDRMGGSNLPGRCTSIKEARKKIRRLLNGDQTFLEHIKQSQSVLLEPMKPENCENSWRAGFDQIKNNLANCRLEDTNRPVPTRRKRIAVILPEIYRGGTLRGAISFAQALYLGSRQFQEAADIVFFYLEDKGYQPDEHFRDLPKEIMRRPFQWKNLCADDARRAMRYAGSQGWEPAYENYIVPDDGIAQLQDCDLWLFISDRISTPILPITPIAIVVYDYLQRYESLLPPGADQPYITAARLAERVFVSTRFTQADAVQYAGVKPDRVVKLPMLAPEFTPAPINATGQSANYFIWSTNAAPQKNHINAAEALRIYYEELRGTLACQVTGVNTKRLLEYDQPHLKHMAEIISRSKVLRKRLKFAGEISDKSYRKVLSEAHFLWHPGRIDNGTFSVIEAAQLNVPSLSSSYPAMIEIDQQFKLQLAWMDSDAPENMARQLKWMEKEADKRRSMLPGEEQWKSQSIEALASTYWEEVRKCL